MTSTIENSNLSSVRKTIVGIQFLFVAFGSTVLVPLLVYVLQQSHISKFTYRYQYDDYFFAKLMYSSHDAINGDVIII